jgi:hypothetical protein
MDSMGANEFLRHFRMTRAAFDKLLAEISPLLVQRNVQQAINSSGSPLTARTKLAVTLRWLAGGSYLDITRLYGVATKSFFHANGPLWPVIDAINAAFSIEFPIDDTEYLDRVSRGFARFTDQRMTKCVSAIDGWLMETRQPNLGEVASVNAYYNRKCMYGIVVMAGCDSDLSFNLFSALASGATHDSLAWEYTALKKAIEDDHLLPDEYYVVGDEAFTNTQQFLVPWSGRGIGLWKDSFNYHLSAMRQCIERAFGLLTRRWGIFWRPLQCEYARWSDIGTVCAKLHNFCIDNNDPSPCGRPPRDIMPGDAWRVVDNNISPDVDAREQQARSSASRRGPRGRPRGDRRRQITTNLEIAAVPRPAFAKSQSRAGD